LAVRKREWTTRRGEKREAWIVEYSVNGARHIETFARKKDADSRRDEVGVNVRKGTHIAPHKTPTVRQAGENWLTACKTEGLQEATIAGYEQHLRLHIVPRLGDLKLAQISVPILRQFKDRLLTDGCSRDMVRRVLISFGTMLADAQERGDVATNAVRGMKRERRRKQKTDQRRKLKVGVDIPTTKEINAIIAKLADRWRPIIVTAIFSGLRASELRGLTWDSIVWKEHALTVEQRADRRKKIDAPKSEAGERTVPLPKLVINMLREWKARCPKGDLNLVFPSGAGEIEHHANILHRGFEPAQIAAGVVDKDGKPKYALHALRHYYASLLCNREVDGGLELPMKIVQERMGHSSITITANVYGHLFPSDNGNDGLDDAMKSFPSLRAT
jgi:integrase